MKSIGTYLKFKLDGLYKGEGVIIGIDHLTYRNYLIEYYNVILTKKCNIYEATEIVNVFDEEILEYK